MSQFNLDLSYHFDSMRSHSQSIKDVIEAARNYGMTYSDDMARDIFNALYQKNPTLSTADNSQYSQAIRAAIQSPQFQHLRAQTQNSLHWSAVGASLITNKLAEKLQWDEKEQPPIPPPPPDNPQPSNDDNEDEGESRQSEDQPEKESEEDVEGNSQNEKNEGDPSNDGESENSDLDENESDNSDDSEGESENEKGQPNSEDGESEPESESENESDESGSDESEESEQSKDGDSDEPELDDESEDGNDSGDSEDEQPGDSESDSDDSENAESQPIDEPLRPASKDVMDALNEAAKEMDEMLGGVRAGSSESIFGANENNKLAELYTALGKNPRLAKIIQMIGRLNINQTFLPGVTYAENQTPVRITQGRNIPAVLPQDLGLLVGKSKEEFMLFMQKYNNKELLQREFEAKNSAGKGPMILCVDQSGSMDESKSHWAQSLAIAMYFQCLKERRQFAVIPFASRSEMLPLPKSTSRMDAEFMPLLVEQRYLGGGTNFSSPWVLATNLIRSDKRWKSADIVFLTDGFGHFDPGQWRRDKEQLGIRLVSFFIGPERTFRDSYYQLKDMIDLSDAFSPIFDLSESGEKAALNLIRNKDAKSFEEEMTKPKARIRRRY